MRLHAILLLLVAGSSFRIPCPAQDATSSAAIPGDFFSGTIVSCSSTEVVVSRKGLGKDSLVTRTFTIDSKTKVEGSLKPKAHITVRFMPGEDEKRAVHIIVR